MPASPATRPLLDLLDWIDRFQRALMRSSLSLAPMMYGVAFLHRLRAEPYKKLCSVSGVVTSTFCSAVRGPRD